MKKKILSVFVSLGLLFVIFLQVDLGGVYDSLVLISLPVLFFAFLVNVFGAVFLNTAQIFFQVAPYMKLNLLNIFCYLLGVDFLIRYYSLVMPTAATAGVRWYFQSRIGLNKTLSGVSVVVNKLLNLFFIFLFSMISIWLIEIPVKGIAGFDKITFLGFIFILAIVTLILIIVIESKKGAVLFASLLLKGIDSKHALMKRYVKTAFYSINNYKREKPADSWQGTTKRLSFLFVWPFLSFVIVAYSQLIVMQGLGLSIGFSEALLVRGAVLLAMMLPFSFAGIGLREASVVGVLSLFFDVAVNDALAVSIILFIFQLLISLIGFLISIIGLRNKSLSTGN